MKKQSRSMRKMTRLYRWVIPVVLLYMIAISFCIAAMGVKVFGKIEATREKAVTFQAYGGKDIYSSLRVKMMTYEFAYDFKETNHYYFAYDDALHAYIVKIHGKLSNEYLDVQSYLYNDSEETPDPMMLYGMTCPIDNDIRQYAIESYNNIFNEEIITEDNFSKYFGEYYLDTTRNATTETVSILINCFVLIGVVFGLSATIILVFSLRSKRFKIGRATLEKSSTEQLHLTSEYMVTNTEEIEKQERVEENSDLVKSRLELPIVGAILGTLVGVGLWVLMGQLGFIAGIAGFVMLKFSLSGYEKLGGTLDKKGVVTCLIITTVMICGANLLDYAVSITRGYFQYDASLETVSYVFVNFSKLMSVMNLWKDFFRDLVIGYGLSIWSCASIIKRVIKM